MECDKMATQLFKGLLVRIKDTKGLLAEADPEKVKKTIAAEKQLVSLYTGVKQTNAQGRLKTAQALLTKGRATDSVDKLQKDLKATMVYFNTYVAEGGHRIDPTGDNAGEILADKMAEEKAAKVKRFQAIADKK